MIREIILSAMIMVHGYSDLAQISRVDHAPSRSVQAIKGDYYYQFGNVINAISSYRKAIEQTEEDLQSVLNLAEIYQRLGYYQLAALWYEHAIKMNPEIPDGSLRGYILSLIHIYEYEKAGPFIGTYNQRISEGNSNDSIFSVVKNLQSINSDHSESGLILYNRQGLFFSNRPLGEDNKGYNLFRSEKDASGKFLMPVNLTRLNTSNLDQGPLAITNRTSQLYLTQGQAEYQDFSRTKMEIWTGDLSRGSLNEIAIEKVRIRGTSSPGHPAVNEMGTKLIFVAQNENGDSDLYQSEFDGKKWTKASPLIDINSSKDEITPVWAGDSVLYFSSNRKGGQGDFDIYSVNLRDKNHQVLPLPLPINSKSADYAYYPISNVEGYFTSDRPGGLGAGDIYAAFNFNLKSRITEGENTNRLEKFKFPLYGSEGNVFMIEGERDGAPRIEFAPADNYQLTITSLHYQDPLADSQEASRKIQLLSRNYYNFEIGSSNQELATKGQDEILGVHADPGYLVVFQLTPTELDTMYNSKTSIRYQGSGVNVSSVESFVFGYVTDGGIISDVWSVQQSALMDEDELLVKDGELASGLPAVPVHIGSNTQLTFENDDASDNQILDIETEASVVQIELDDDSPITGDAVQVSSSIDRDRETVISSLSFMDEIKAKGSLAALSDLKLSNLPVGGSYEKLEGIVIPSTTEEFIRDEVDKPIDLLSESEGQDPVLGYELTGNDTLIDEEVDADMLKEVLAPIDSSETKTGNETVARFDPDMHVMTGSDNPNVDSDTVITQFEVEDDSVNPLPSIVAEDTKTEFSEPRFRVQVAASRIEISSAELGNIYKGSNEVKRFQENGYYKYYMFESADYGDALQSLKSSGVKGAFISAYEGEKKLILKEAIAYQRSKKEKHTVDHDNSLTNIPVREPASRDSSDESVQIDNREDKRDVVNTEELSIVDQLVFIESKKDVEVTAKDDIKEDMVLPNHLGRTTDISPAGLDSVKIEKKVARDLLASTVTVSDNVEDKDLIRSKLSKEETENLEYRESVVTDDPIETTPVTIDKFQYRVQIAASRKEISDDQLKRIYEGPHSVEFFEESGYFKYYLYESSNFFEIKSILDNCGVEGAFISAYKDDEKMVLRDALSDQYQKPTIGEINNSDSIVNVATVIFNYNEIDLSRDQLSRLENYVIGELVSNPKLYAIINGNSGSTKDAGNPFRYGIFQERVKMVRQNIVSENIHSDRVQIKHLKTLQYSTFCRNGRNCPDALPPSNRQVEIIIMKERN